MKRKRLIYMIACMAVCLIPSFFMLFFPTTKTTENKAMAKAPRLITEDGKLNQGFFDDFESYFTQHMAFRNQLVYTDAKLQTGLFGVSNVSGVLYGSDGWLYYSSTLDDYQGTDLMTERELFNLAHNLSVTQTWLQERDIDFVLTIPPNKNTLYPEHMPYYDSVVVDTDHNAKLLVPLLEENQVNYLNLFELFENRDEELYLKRDSHWNMDGANLAYDALMNSLNRNHRVYSSEEAAVTHDEDGDLNRMLYSFYGKTEDNSVYPLEGQYTYTGTSSDVESGWLTTESEGGKGTLLMFRDSFGNTLIPFLSGEFSSAYYSKGQPHALERYVETASPDCVIIEKVERNVADYLNAPPIVGGVKTEEPKTLSIAETASTVEVTDCEYDANFVTITGVIDPQAISEKSEIVMEVNDICYLAYQTGENGCLLYLKRTDLNTGELDVKIYVVNDDSYRQVLRETLSLPPA